MDTLIQLKGFYYRKHLFNLERAEAVRRGLLNGIILTQGGNFVTILKTNLESQRPIAAIVRIDNEDFLRAINKDGFDANSIQYFVYSKTAFRTYDDYFGPNTYEACLIRLRGVNEACWEVAVCEGYNKDNYPTFFDHDNEYVYDRLPLDDCTKTIIGKKMSWEEYVKSMSPIYQQTNNEH